MELLRVTYRIVTPLFLSGAKPDDAELRGPSIKGALRYWYRAIDPRYNLSKNIESLKKGESPTYEGDLFGGTGQEEGQARFLLRLHGSDLQKEVWKGKREHPFFLRYLGFSLDRNRKYFIPEQTFSISFRLRPLTGDEEKAREDWQCLIASIWLLGHIGGLGSRSRRGFGTVALESWTASEGSVAQEVLQRLPIAHGAKSRTEWVERFSEGLEEIRSWFPEYTEADHTVIKKDTSFLLAEAGASNWRQALNKGGEILKGFRESVKRQDRASLGMPLLIPQRKIQYTPVVGDRAASPVWIRVVEIEGRFFPLFSFFAAPAPRIVEKGSYRNDSAFDVPMEEILDRFRQYLQNNGFSLEVSL